jgi:hypothetical protein
LLALIFVRELLGCAGFSGETLASKKSAEVYWRHRIWPEERRDSKPPLDSVMSQAQMETKAGQATIAPFA